MDLHHLGFTRSRVTRNHALITPDTHVRATLPGWEKAQIVVLVSPDLGAGFTQYLVELAPGGLAATPAEGVQRFAYVLEGRLEVQIAGRTPLEDHTPAVLGPGGFVYLPPGLAHELRAPVPCRVHVFEKHYQPLAGAGQPWPVLGHEGDIPGQPFAGDEDARLQVLLPDDPAFDMAVNIFTYRPGASLPFVEVHVMEHGLLMLQGGGVYRLDDAWYPVRAGDAIWMGPYCPQWFCAVGKEPARYLYYKDVNRVP